jgi:hypothetical protein
MNEHLHSAGKQLLRALSKHADLVMDTYLAGSVDESRADAADLEKLTRLGVLWRPEADAGLRLRRVVRSLLEEGLRDIRNRQIDANLGSALTTIKTITSHFKEARFRHAAVEADSHLGDLQEHVYALTESLKHNVRVLWERINNGFGYVASIEAKIRENELAQSQVSDMLMQLEMIRFDELAELAGQDRDLRRLLIVTLQSVFAEVNRELGLVQGKLIELIGRFREFQGRTRLLKGFLLHMERKPDYQPANYAGQSQVPTLFNQAAAILQPASADVNNSLQEQDLLQLAGAIRAWQHSRTSLTEDRDAIPVRLFDQEHVALQEDRIRQAVEGYFCTVIDDGQALSALEYHARRQFDFDKELWIYQVIGGYEALSAEEKAFFEMDQVTRRDAVFDNLIIEDVALWLS